MSHTLTPRERRDYLIKQQALVQRWLCRLLAAITGEDVAAMSPAQREQLAVVLARLPEAIPVALVCHLRAALGTEEVAA